MGGLCGYIGFFRIRSSVRLVATGDPSSASWVAKAIEYMDFSHSIMLQETVRMAQKFPGLFSYKEYSELPFDRYESMIEYTKEAIQNG